jgi:hypothetical protein
MGSPKSLRQAYIAVGILPDPVEAQTFLDGDIHFVDLNWAYLKLSSPFIRVVFLALDLRGGFFFRFSAAANL